MHPKAASAATQNHHHLHPELVGAGKAAPALRGAPSHNRMQYITHNNGSQRTVASQGQGGRPTPLPAATYTGLDLLGRAKSSRLDPQTLDEKLVHHDAVTPKCPPFTHMSSMTI